MPQPTLDLRSKKTESYPKLILGGLGQVTLLTLFSSTWKRRMKWSRGVSLPDRRNAAHQEPLAKPLMDKMGFVSLFHSPDLVSKSAYLGTSAWSFERHPKEKTWAAASQTNCCFGAGCRQRAVVCTKVRSSVWIPSSRAIWTKLRVLWDPQSRGCSGLCPGTKTWRVRVSIASSDLSIWCHRLQAVSSRLLTVTNKITDHLPAIKAYGRKCQIVSFVRKMVLQKWQLEHVQAALGNLYSSHNAHIFSVVFNPVYLAWTNSPELGKETFLSWNSKYSDASESLQH